jgi:hypothetical protein
MSYMKLNVPRHVYERRLQRMVKLIEMKAPAIIIYHEARLIKSAYQPGLWHRIEFAFIESRLGLWLILLPEWVKFKLTGVSDVYAPEPSMPAEWDARIRHLLAELTEPTKTVPHGTETSRLGRPTSCPACFCDGSEILGCLCVCHD